MSGSSAAGHQVEQAAKKASNKEQLQLYGLFKQSTVGDVNTSRPGLLRSQERAKWDAWKANQGMSKESAEEKYVELVDSINAKDDK